MMRFDAERIEPSQRVLGLCLRAVVQQHEFRAATRRAFALREHFGEPGGDVARLAAAADDQHGIGLPQAEGGPLRRFRFADVDEQIVLRFLLVQPARGISRSMYSGSLSARRSSRYSSTAVGIETPHVVAGGGRARRSVFRPAVRLECRRSRAAARGPSCGRGRANVRDAASD